MPGVGIDYEKKNLCRVNRLDKRRELNILANDFVLISVGELHKRKNHRMILEALKIMDTSNISYIMTGIGPLRNEYEKIIEDYGLKDVVHLVGFRDDVFELYMMSDCMIHPTIREGLGMAPLEAMACGLPLINTYVNGMKDYTEDGVSGICLRSFSPYELAKSIEKMRDDEEFRKQCGHRNKIKAEEFSYKVSEKVMQTAYSEITNI